jgi:hypothetical protein
MAAAPLAPLALSRTCALQDFPGCLSVATWQQCLADEAWAQWTAAEHLRTRHGGLVVNYSGVDFRAPGPTASAWHYAETPAARNGDGAGEGPVPAVYGLCVLDRIAAPVAFLTQAGALLGPHGLLFLTFAYWDAEGEDTAAGHDERRRIYSAHSVVRLIREARRLGFENFGGTEWTYHGNLLEDHSLASLVMVRR